MKTLLLFLSIISMSFNAEGYYVQSELIIKEQNRNEIVVALNGVWTQPSRTVNFSGLEEGSHFLEIKRRKVHHHPITGPYEIFEMVFSGHLVVPSSSRLMAVVNKWGEFRVVKSIPLFNTVHENNYYGNAGNSCAGVSNVFNHHEFQGLVNAVEEECFDKDRLQLALFSIRYKNITAHQLSVLMKKITFESNRLKLAQQGYAQVVDPQNIHFVYEAFDFSSSKRRLMSYIQNNY